MKRSKAPLLLGLGCVLAMGMMLYPMASNWLSGQTRSQVITEYETALEVLDNQATQQALELAQAYNRDLLEQSCSIAGFSVGYYSVSGRGNQPCCECMIVAFSWLPWRFPPSM